MIAAARACTWLARVAHRGAGAGQPAPTTLLRSLVGCWICARGLGVGGRDRRLRGLAREVARRLDRTAAGVLHRGDGELAWLGAGILRALERPSAALEALVQEAGPAIPGARPGAPRLDGLLQAPNPFRGSASSIRAVASQVVAATAWGRRVCSPDAGLRQRLAVAVPVWMVAALRDYDLELGALLLRTMGYLRLRRDRLFGEGLAFLLLQQQPDGRFGFLARDRTPRSPAALEARHVALTVACLWAIAEASNPRFVLHRSLAPR